MSELVLGIDLGTTSSCISVFDGKRLQGLTNEHGYRITPSCAAITPDNRFIIGHSAKQQAITNAGGTVIAFKRLMGQAWQSQEVQALRRRAPYEIVSGVQGQASVRLHGRTLSPVELSANLLRALRDSAEAQLGTKVNKAVITVPAHFNELQRQATMLAARMAGLEPMRLLNEPTAAALAYSTASPKSGRRKIAVYDLGGGTFDITVLAVEGDVYEVLATGGDSFLGGEDFDDLIVEHWGSQLAEKGIDSSDAGVKIRLREAAERAKVALSSRSAVVEELPHLAEQDGRPFHFQGAVTRSQLSRMCEPLIKRTLEKCGEALAEAGVKPNEIDEVVLIGGMSRMPAVQAGVQRFFSRPPAKGIHPEEAVSAGAAICGHALGGGKSNQVLVDVLPHSLGVVSLGRCMPILQKGTRLPARRVEMYSTSADNQTSVRVRVMQGESADPAENVLLGIFEICDLPPRPRGEVSFLLEFLVTSNGLLEVTATDSATGRRNVVKVSEIIRNGATSAQERSRLHA